MSDIFDVIDGLGVSKLAPIPSGANPDFLVIKMDGDLAQNVQRGKDRGIPVFPLVIMDMSKFDDMQSSYQSMIAFTWEQNPITKDLFNAKGTGVLNNKEFSAILLRITDDGCFTPRNKQYATDTWVVGLTNSTKTLLENKFGRPVIVDISDEVMRNRCGDIYSYLERWLVCQRGTTWLPSKITVMSHLEGSVEYTSKLLQPTFYNVVGYSKPVPPTPPVVPVIPVISESKLLAYLYNALITFAKTILDYKV